MEFEVAPTYCKQHFAMKAEKRTGKVGFEAAING